MPQCVLKIRYTLCIQCAFVYIYIYDCVCLVYMYAHICDTHIVYEIQKDIQDHESLKKKKEKLYLIWELKLKGEQELISQRRSVYLGRRRIHTNVLWREKLGGCEELKKAQVAKVGEATGTPHCELARQTKILFLSYEQWDSSKTGF